MTIEEMKKLVQKHAALESSQEAEGILATLVENPVYEIYPAHQITRERKHKCLLSRTFRFIFPTYSIIPIN